MQEYIATAMQSVAFVNIYSSCNQLTKNTHVPCHLIFSGAFALILHFVSLLHCTFSAILRLLEVHLHLPFLRLAFIAVCVICRLEPVFDLHVVISNKTNLRIFPVVATLRTFFVKKFKRQGKSVERQILQKVFTLIKASRKVSL